MKLTSATNIAEFLRLSHCTGSLAAGLLALVLPFLLCEPARAQAATVPVKENLGPNINTERDEVLPVISPDSRILYYVRKDNPENIGGGKDDIWYSEVQPDGTWGVSKNIGPPLNTTEYNYLCAALPDNNTLLLGNNYFPDGTQRQGVSISYRTRTGWGTPINLLIRNFYNKSKNSEFTMSPDGKVLIMSIEGATSMGERDLYLSTLMEDNSWSEPENLGPAVNSSQTDITPFLAADASTLYFSSSRPGGFGSNDIYVTRRLDSTWRKWTQPVNLGYPINTSGWDAYYSVPASGEYAYFVSTANSIGKSDIFRVKLPKEAQPKPVLIVHGTIRDVDGNPVPARVIYERLSDGKQVGSAFADPRNGEYTLALPSGENYGFRAEYEGYYAISENVDLTRMEKFDEQTKDLVLAPIKVGTAIRLNNIFFDFDMATLRPESISELNRLTAFLKQHPLLRIKIQGHTDNYGTDEYNIDLSNRRAQSVVDYLIGVAIPASRLESQGFGETVPIDTNETDEGRQNNRRVEFMILE